jgi:putative DNA primase/helicase
MSDVGQVVAQMSLAGLPPLPGLPKLDGKFNRFGPKKKAWYVLRELTLKSGRRVVTGAFGRFYGANYDTIPVTIDSDEMSDDERADLLAKQREHEAKVAEEKQQEARLAANRARDQWQKAQGVPVVHSYLDRKQVTAEGVRVSKDGHLLIPMMRAGQIVGLQKIDPSGEKRFNKGMDKVGAACPLGSLDDAEIIAVGEGYATCRSARMAAKLIGMDLPVVAAFDAGSILAVAQALRKQYPRAYLLFLADDDYQLEPRLIERLREDYKLSQPVLIDGVTHAMTADDGEVWNVTATWRKDKGGIDYIDVDVRNDRSVRSPKFENAGLSRSTAAARNVGNAGVAMPLFQARGDRKLTDWNDLHVEESLETVAAQLSGFILAAKQPKQPPPADQAVEPAVQAAAHIELNVIAIDAPETAASPAPSPDACGAEGSDAAQGPAFALPPPPLVEDAAQEATGLVSLDWALSHCALVQGTTDVWDSLNKLRMKKSAFLAMVGKESAKAWENSPKRRSISPRNLPATKRGVADAGGGAGDDSLLMMLERYTLLYPTKTLWDHDKRKVVAYDAMVLARGSTLAERWLEHPMRREVDLDNLVFDPTQRVDLKTHINMFEGFPLKPKRDEEKAKLAIGLLYSLCASEANCDELFHWVMCWLAYPLQHPGAKMQTALLFFGEKQGTGKSLFFEGIVKPIYGAHGATGGQNQLEAQYTMWRSQKLFVLFEEILSRQDKYHGIGLIKHMITGRDQPISQKFKDDRVENNHLNCVMLSNEFQAVPLEPHDRRFLVVDVRTDLNLALLDKIKAALDHGLVEAFYAYLLEYPLGDFNEHTKPVMTAAKERVISFGRPDWEVFYLAWAAGELDAPYCSCLSNDLYLVYDRYCSRYGLRGQSLTKFAELMGNRLKKDRQWVTIGTKKKLLTVLHVPDQPDDDPDESLSKRCERFRKLADIKTEV